MHLFYIEDDIVILVIFNAIQIIFILIFYVDSLLIFFTFIY